MVQCASPQNCWLINCNITRLCSPTVCPQCAEIALHVNKMAPAVPFSPHQQSQHCPDIHYENAKPRSSIVKVFVEMPSPGQVFCSCLWKRQTHNSSGQALSRYLWKCQTHSFGAQILPEMNWMRKSRPLINKVSGLAFIKTVNAVKKTLLGSWSSLRIRFRSPIHFAVVLKGEPSLLGRYPIGQTNQSDPTKVLKYLISKLYFLLQNLISKCPSPKSTNPIRLVLVLVSLALVLGSGLVILV